MTPLNDKFPNICFVKTAWADEYQGEDVYGRHAYVQTHKDGHERFNFKPGPDGRYYGSIPPHKLPDELSNWLIIFVAASTENCGRTFGPLLPVGWFEGASFVEPRQRPEYETDRTFPVSKRNTNYTFSVISELAYLIPKELREVPLPQLYGRKLGMASKIEVLVNGKVPQLDDWRTAYAEYAIDLLRRFSPDSAEEGKERSGAHEGAAAAENPTNRGYASAEHRKRVELAAERVAKKTFSSSHLIKNVTKENCGYDFHLTCRSGGPDILLEVKGTSGKEPAFFLTRNELKHLNENPEKYHVFLVTSALSKSPDTTLLTSSDVRSQFTFEPLAYHVTRLD